MENINDFQKNFVENKPQAIVLRNANNDISNTAKIKEQEKQIMELTNANKVLKIEIDELKEQVKALNLISSKKDEAIKKLKSLNTFNLNQYINKQAELKRKLEDFKSSNKNLEVGNEVLSSENEMLRSLINDKDDKIKSLKNLNELNSKEYEAKTIETEHFYQDYVKDNDKLKNESESLRSQLQEKQKEIDFLKEAFLGDKNKAKNFNEDNDVVNENNVLNENNVNNINRYSENENEYDENDSDFNINNDEDNLSN